jgi:predicted molibdopterin-dependent oxidoreductase YjgC
MALSSKAVWRGGYDEAGFASTVRDLTAAMAEAAGTTENDMTGLVELLREGPVVVLYDDAFDGVADTGDALTAVADLVEAIAGAAGAAGVIPLLDECNSMGARDLGLYPGNAPHGTSLADALSRGDSGIRALLSLGVDLARDVPGAVGALQALDLLVVTDLMMTETARLAHVVLPAASFAEKTGTLTNTERRIQLLQPAVPRPGIARSEWEVLVDLSQAFDQPLGYAFADQVWDDIQSATPAYSGLRYQDIGPRGTRPRVLQPV